MSIIQKQTVTYNLDTRKCHPGQAETPECLDHNYIHFSLKYLLKICVVVDGIYLHSRIISHSVRSIGKITGQNKGHHPHEKVYGPVNSDILVLCRMQNESHHKATKVAVTSLTPGGKARKSWQEMFAVVFVPLPRVLYIGNHGCKKGYKKEDPVCHCSNGLLLSIFCKPHWINNKW